MAELLGPSDLPRGVPVGSIVVLLHGVGADGADLIGLAPMLRRRLPDAALYAPDAPYPCDLAPYGRQWFSLQDRRPAALLAGIRRAAPLVDRLIDDLLARHRLPPGRLALLGFSQGTMLALHVALRRAEPIAAVVGFSGALVGAETLPAEARSRPPVMLIHGDADDIIPVEALWLTLDGLQGAGIPVQWIVRPGLPHSIDEHGLEAGGKFLQLCLAHP